MKMIFSAIRMNNPTVRNIMLHIHDKDTTSERSIKKMIVFGNEDEQSDVPKYHASNARQSG